MLTWNETTKRDPSGKVIGTGYTAQLPHWGEASIHTRIHHPGELFLDCLSLGIDTYPLGQVSPMDAMGPAEMVLMRTLEEHAIWCLEAMVAIGGTED